MDRGDGLGGAGPPGKAAVTSGWRTAGECLPIRVAACEAVMGWRRIDSGTVKAAVLASHRAGLTLARASAAAGVHVATVCRWQVADPKFAGALRTARLDAARERYAARAAERPPRLPRRGPDVRLRKPVVPIHLCCPACGSLSETRRVAFGPPVTFWRCSRWPLCPWASWRPRCPVDCPDCRGPLFWSGSRLSVSCPRCRTRRPVQSGNGPCE